MIPLAGLGQLFHAVNFFLIEARAACMLPVNFSCLIIHVDGLSRLPHRKPEQQQLFDLILVNPIDLAMENLRPLASIIFEAPF
jgi:hypothetical protein